MAEEDFNQVSSSFETVQCILSSILCPSIFREIWRHCNGLLHLSPINATSSSSYVFILQYPRVLHCRIVPIEKLETLVALERKKPPITLVVSESKRSNLKVTCKFAKTPLGLHDRGGVNIFKKRLFAPQASQIHYIYCIFIIYDKNNKYLRIFIINHKNTKNIIYLVRLLWWRTNVS